jgi:hypothetical protein
MINRALIALALTVPLAACAGGSGSGQSYASELDALDAGCRERGGILAPTGAQTGDPARDHVCKISGQPARAG